MKAKTLIRLLPNKNMVIAIIICAVLFSGGIYFINNYLNEKYDSQSLILKGEKLENEFLEKTNTKTSSNTSDDKANNKTQIYVYIAGEVKNPGVIKAQIGDRLYQCLEKAGGATEKADLLEHNLALKVKDGDKFIFKDKTINTGDSNDFDKTNPNNSNNFSSENNGKVSLSKGSKEELKSISGIGDKTAEKIIKFRQQNGDFKNIDDLVKIEGIGHGLLNKIRNEITP